MLVLRTSQLRSCFVIGHVSAKKVQFQDQMSLAYTTNVSTGTAIAAAIPRVCKLFGEIELEFLKAKLS